MGHYRYLTHKLIHVGIRIYFVLKITEILHRIFEDPVPYKPTEWLEQ